MKNRFVFSRFLLLIILGIVAMPSFAFRTGIYISQLTAEDPIRMDQLIKGAKASGIDTFVIDYSHTSEAYKQALDAVKQNGIRYVARIVMFPGGGTRDQIKSSAYLAERLARVKQAIQLGAKEIQLDYIRYKPSQAPSKQNAEDIEGVIAYFKKQVQSLGSELQVDVFGISSFKPSLYIGQDVQLIAKQVDAICPMVYPSHYEPFRVHAQQPYRTVLESVLALKDQINQHPEVKVYPYIELFNYRYPLSPEQRVRYIQAQLKAVKDSGANGWYAWSAGNRYEILFDLLKDYHDKTKVSIQ